MNIFDSLNLQGLAVGLVTFLIIGLFHPLVIKGEYYMGQKCNMFFALGGVLTLFASLYLDGTLSIIAGVTSFSCFWSILEVKEQRERVRKGWFPENPKRTHQKNVNKSKRNLRNNI